MHPRAAQLIETLGLVPHPEGGFFREIFRSPHRVSAADGRDRSALTTIYFLLPAASWSRWHRVVSDEVWHWYEGGPLEILELDADGTSLSRQRLGAVDANQRPVFTVAAGHWQAARPLADFALMGCTVGPGFDFSDFTLLADDAAMAAKMRESWPEVAALI